MVRCSFGKLADVLAEPNATDLILAYVEELSPLRDTLPVAPDWPKLQAMEEAGLYKLWVCRVDGTLAGFISYVIMPHHNYRDTLWAFDHGHYLAPAYRNTPGQIGLKMWRSGDAALKALGVRYSMVHSGQRSLLPYMLHLGYAPFSTLFWKEL